MTPEQLMVILLHWLVNQTEDKQLLIPKTCIEEAQAGGQVFYVDADSDDENFIVTTPTEEEATKMQAAAEARARLSLPAPQTVTKPEIALPPGVQR